MSSGNGPASASRSWFVKGSPGRYEPVLTMCAVTMAGGSFAAAVRRAGASLPEWSEGDREVRSPEGAAIDEDGAGFAGGRRLLLPAHQRERCSQRPSRAHRLTEES